MCPFLKTDTEIQVSVDPYESFMLHHFKHYGLFTDRRPSFQSSLTPSHRFGQDHGSVLSDKWGQDHGSVLSDKWGQDHGSVLTDNSPDSSETASDSQEEDSEISSRPFSLTLEQGLRTRQLVFDFDGGRPIPRLREPRSLFGIQSLSSPHRGVRWPIECDVIKERIHHIEWDPPEPELFYHPTGYERTPMPMGAEKGKMMYCIESATKSSYFTCARVGGSRGPVRSATPSVAGREDSTLEFESRFESGNLQKAVQVGVHDYELTLRTDLYTSKHTQWFYFRVRKMRVGVAYRFTIINLMKSNSLYNLGMKPLLYSEQAAQMQAVGWQRVGANIKYYRNQTEHEGHPLYSLTWTCQFPYEGDTCYFAHCYPYTYSDLQRYLTKVASDPSTAAYCKLRVLCHSLAGNAVYVLTVTSPSPTREAGRAKRAVVVTARVHPGETNSSWMMQGFLDFLLGDSPDARLLRDTFVFKVVPMLNPDGVVVGNYRCSLAGRDLNRNYRTLLRDSFPCVWHTRNMVKRVMAEREVVLYCDFHGHSRKNNVFMYGCDNRHNTALRLHERVFPLMMSKNVTDKFSYRSCKFRVQKSKEGTGRIVMWKLGIANSYTMESTFGGSTLGKRKGTHFTTQDLKSLGYYFCDTLLDYCDPDPTKASHCLVELGAILRQQICQKLGRDLDSNGSFSSVSMSDIESSTSGSNSTESNGLPVHLLNINNEDVLYKKKHLKTRKERNRLRQERVQNSEAKVTHQSTNNTQVPMVSNKEAAKAGIQAVETLSKSKKGKKVRIRAGQTWIPHSASRVNISEQAPLWKDKLETDLHLEVVTAAYLHIGDPMDFAQPAVTDKPDLDARLCRRHQFRSFSSHAHRQAPHRQPLIVTAIQQSAIPQQPLPFSLDNDIHSGIRGRFSASHTLTRRTPAASQLMECRMVPQFIPSLALMPARSLHASAKTADRPKRNRDTKEPTRVSIRYHFHETSTASTDSMEAKKSRERDRTAGASCVIEMDNISAGSVSDSTAKKHAVDLLSFLPDLRKQNLSADFRGHVRPSEEQTMGGLVKVANLETVMEGDAASENLHKEHGLSQVASPEMAEMTLAFPRVGLASSLLLERPCPQRHRLQRLQRLTLAEGTKDPSSRRVTAKAQDEHIPANQNHRASHSS